MTADPADKNTGNTGPQPRCAAAAARHIKAGFAGALAGLAVIFASVAPDHVRAQQSTETDLIIAAWTEFNTFCIPFFENPRAALNALPKSGPGIMYGITRDKKVVEYDHTSPDEIRSEFVNIREIDNRLHLECGHSRIFDSQRFSARNLAQSFESIAAATGNLTISGGEGRMIAFDEATGSIDQAEEFEYFDYLISGAFPEREEIIEVEIIDEVFTISVFELITEQEDGK